MSMRRLFVGWVIGASLASAGCGGGGGGGGGPPATPPTPTTFTLGPDSTVPPFIGGDPPTSLLATTLMDHDDDGFADLAWVVSTNFMGAPLFDIRSMPGVGDGSFAGDYGGGGYRSVVTPLLDRGDVLGAGHEGYVLATENPAGTLFVRTLGFRIVGMSRSSVGGFGFATGTLGGLTVGDFDGDGIDDVAVLDLAGRRAIAFL